MTQELFEAMKQSVIDGDEEQAAELAQQALAQALIRWRPSMTASCPASVTWASSSARARCSCPI